MILKTLLAVGTLVLMTAGCAGAPGETLPPETPPAETVSAPAEATPAEAVPLTTVRTGSPEAFAEAGIPLEAPFCAKNVSCKWDGETAQVEFTLNGVTQVWRGGRDQAAVERDYPQTEESVTICACGAYYSQTTEERTYKDGSEVALWSFGDLHFSLYTAPHEGERGADPFSLGQYVANRLDEYTWMGTMGEDEKFFPEQTDAELILTDVTAQGLTLRVEDSLGRDMFTHGVDYMLWKLVGDEWRQVPGIEPLTPEGGPSIDYHANVDYNWDFWRYGKLTPGSYRMTKEICWGSGENLETAIVYADFTIE
ncbi:MAG: hypothetical protein HFF18_11770 [Oscillospiraceae bacterium]|nr:hypothetical protein [Oscillospiraceae bacterium]